MAEAGSCEQDPGRRFGQGLPNPGEHEDRQQAGWSNADAAVRPPDGGQASPGHTPSSVTAALTRLREAAAAHDEN
jgi:hypothetical protein